MAYPTSTVSFRPSKKTLQEFLSLLKQEAVEKSEVAREIFFLGLKEYKVRRALKSLQEGKISFLKAAELAGLSAYELLDVVRARKIEYVEITEHEMEKEVQFAKAKS